ncbi:MAG: glycosyltransferase family 4 protein [Verrucomicrobia bacterium]|nr:glycosyltransferase family 4 protein [Verrucomicrobiota bacterium]
MKILVLAAFKPPGFVAKYGTPTDGYLGGQRKVGLLIRAMLRAGHHVDVISSAISCRNGWGIQRPGVCRYRTPDGEARVFHPPTWLRKPFGGLAMAAQVTRAALALAPRLKPDVVFAYNSLLPEACGVLALQRVHGLPYVLEVDDLPGVRHSPRSARSLLNRLPWSAVLSGASAFIAVNGPIADRLPHDGRPVHVLPGVLEDELVHGSQARRAPFSRPTVRALYAGNLSEDRGADVLLRAIPDLPPGVQLRVAGAGVLAPAFECAARLAPDRCAFLGLLSGKQVSAELLSSDVAINTPERLTDQDGVFPFKILEYLASGALMISPRLPSIPGRDLRWCSDWDGSAAGLVDALRTARGSYGRHRAAIADAGAWALSHFSIDAAAAAISQTVSGSSHR